MKKEIKTVASEEVVTAINGEKVNEFNLQQVLDGEVEFSDIVDKTAFFLACLDKNKERMKGSENYNRTELEFYNDAIFALVAEQRILQEVVNCAVKKIADLEMLNLQRELTEEEKDVKLNFKKLLQTTTDKLIDTKDKINLILKDYTTTFKFVNK